ncbi:MAG: hypothetical protein ABI977_28410, partial [Acidobacteriota bacterium]
SLPACRHGYARTLEAMRTQGFPKETTMKRSIIALIAFCFFTLAIASGTASAQTPGSQADPQAAMNRQLLAEIKQLRLDLLRQRLEFQQWKRQQIERELQSARAEQQRLAEEEEAMQQELAELNNTSGGQSELELLKAELTGNRKRLLAHQQPVHQRVAELTAQLNQEDMQLSQLTQRLKTETDGTIK